MTIMNEDQFREWLRGVGQDSWTFGEGLDFNGSEVYLLVTEDRIIKFPKAAE